jgi:hypothetical protein
MPSQQIKGVSMKVVPEHFLKLMSAEDRKPLGKAGFTSAEVREICTKKAEKEMHEVFTQWLNLNNIYHVHSRMDKKSTIAKGTPDFTIVYGGKGFFIEFKTPQNTLSDEQKVHMKKIMASGTQYFLCYDAKEAIEVTRKIINV